MTKSTTIVAAAAALGLMGLVNAASAVPAAGALTSAGAALKVDGATTADNVAWTCWWHRSHRHCGYVRPRVFSYYAVPTYRWGWRRGY
jgi:hypothetical protein